MFTVRQPIASVYGAASTTDDDLNLGEHEWVVRYRAMKELGKSIHEAARRADSMARLELSLGMSSAARPAASGKAWRRA